MEYVTLLGAENVEHAAREIAGAAERMERATSQLDFTLERFATRFEESAQRIVDAVEKASQIWKPT